MSAITDLYDALDTMLAATFATPTYKKLANPYTLELNDTLSLSRGWGFKIGPKSAANLTLARYEQFQVEISIIQTIAQRGTDRDIVIRQNAEKTLLEDQFLLVDYLRQNTALFAKLWKLDYSSDSGIEFVPFTEQQNYFTITTSLTAIIAEGC
jgi:hypothetical protein